MARGHQTVRKCYKCVQTFTSRDLLQKHITRVHFKTKKDLTCPYCLKVCSSRRHLAVHIALSHRKKSRREKSNLRQGKVIGKGTSVRHSGSLNKEVERNSTELSSGQQKQAVTKSTKEHMTDKQKERQSDLPPGGASELVKCTVCDMSFLNQPALRMHQSVRHKDQHKMSVTEKIQLIKQRTCPVCSRIFGSVHAMNIHKTRIHRSGSKGDVQRSVHANTLKNNAQKVSNIISPRIHGSGPKDNFQSGSKDDDQRGIHVDVPKGSAKKASNIVSPRDNSTKVKKIGDSRNRSVIYNSQNKPMKAGKQGKSGQNHAGKTTFSCTKCSRTYPTFQQLRSHQFHEWIAGQKGKYNCLLCKRVFASQHWLNHHDGLHHPGAMGKIIKERRQSQLGGKTLVTKANSSVTKGNTGINQPETMQSKIIKERRKSTHLAAKAWDSKTLVTKRKSMATERNTLVTDRKKAVNKMPQTKKKDERLQKWTKTGKQGAAVRLRQIKLIEKTKKKKPLKIIGQEKLW